jgi:hypothetical protein
MMNHKELDAFYNTVVDRIVDMVWKRFPDDEKSRMHTYDRISESFAGLVKAFNRPNSQFELPKEEIKEESDDSQP